MGNNPIQLIIKSGKVVNDVSYSAAIVFSRGESRMSPEARDARLGRRENGYFVIWIAVRSDVV